MSRVDVNRLYISLILIPLQKVSLVKVIRLSYTLHLLIVKWKYVMIVIFNCIYLNVEQH